MSKTNKEKVERDRERELDSLRINMTSNLLYDKDLNTNTYNNKCYKEKDINKT